MANLVRDLMRHPVATMSLPAQVGEIRDLMKQKDCHAIPLVDVGENDAITIRGIVTSNDLMGVYDDNVDIMQVMNQPVHIVQARATVRDAAAMMMKYRIHHLLVMEGEEIAGMLSSMDFVKLVAEGKG